MSLKQRIPPCSQGRMVEAVIRFEDLKCCPRIIPPTLILAKLGATPFAPDARPYTEEPQAASTADVRTEHLSKRMNLQFTRGNPTPNTSN